VLDSLSAPSEDIARHVLAMAGTHPSQIEKVKLDGLDRLMMRETESIRFALRELQGHARSRASVSVSDES
jgi:hypothetical protein